MLKKIQNPISAYDKYFKEAPGDEDDQVSVRVAPRANRGTDYSDDTTNVRVRPRMNSGTDYTTTADDTPDDDAEDTTPDDNPDTPDDTDDGTDYNDDGGDDTADDETGDEGGEDNDDPDAPDTEDEGTDYSDDGNDQNDENQNDQGNQNEDDEEPEETQEEHNEKVKKFTQYKKYLHLYNTVDSFIEKLQNIVKNDPIQNAVIKTVTSNLTEVKTNMWNYMTIRYRTASYVQILVYYETIVTIVHLNFELLRNNLVNLKQ